MAFAKTNTKYVDGYGRKQKKEKVEEEKEKLEEKEKDHFL